ncbi:putative amidohydrolase [Salsuginibacillus halophilus]|uniref:Putative amidohydrolase n=1 Tax=Salsuginibacillus halophilus TaxID=517424 RepID=A0A2P8HQE1_9BACI|nr:nitrilase-related carbon-nitrogen hydrolase [Salsuginibacillus halophilus]PSL48450.1 putative amidohydrolase [Salsuginibacillus halophilus]
MKLKLAQTQPVLGDPARNAERVVEDLYRLDEHVELLVYPELSLTGYVLKDQVFDVALTLKSPEIERIRHATADTGKSVMFGFVEEHSIDRVYNAAVYMKAGEVQMVQRKIYPTTYGMFEEGKYFSGARVVKSGFAGDFKSTMLICNDMWHPSLTHIAAHQQTTLLIGMINSPSAGLGEYYSSAAGWERVGRFYAEIYGSYVALANRVGIEEGVPFFGGSKIINPYGEVIAEAPLDKEAEIEAELDLALVKRRRRELPIMRDENLDVTVRHLEAAALEQNNSHE